MIHFNLRKDACTVAIVLATGIFLSVVPQRVWADGPSREEAPVTQRQAGTVTGKVVDAKSGEPIAGANVVVKGTQNGTSTDVNGKFTLEASSHATLVVSFIGYKNLEVPASAAKVVRLSEDAENLNEVVVVAYGTQKKSSVTGSIATVNADALKTVTASNVNNMLQGKVAGVQVLSTSGQPGQAAKIRIRGISSIGSSLDPLWVIDGVVAGTGASLNPNEIASITVLKDAAATALYGSRATNGVILVTTKTGNTNHSSLQVSVKAGIANQTFGRLKMMDSQQLYDYTASMQGLATSGIGTWFNESLLKHNTNWLKMATQTAPSQDYTISYTSGAAKKYRSFLMADYYDEEGTIKGYDFSRYSLRSNNDYIVNDHLTIKTKISGSYSHTFNQEADLYSSYTYLPWDYPYNEDGTVRTGKESNWFGRDASNFYHDLNKDWTREKTLGVTANLGFDYRFNDWLTFESNNSISFRKYLEEVYTDPTAIGAEAYNGSIENENIDYRTRYSNQLLRFNKTFNEKHTIGAFLGYEYSDYRSQDADVAGRGIPSGGQVFDVVTTPYSMKGTINEWAIQSYFANVNYTYDNKYMAQASYRMDGSSRFGSNNRYGSFYTIGGGWTFSQEKFLQDQSKWLTEGKLRASIGSIGNTPNSNYGYLSTYSLSTNYVGVPAAFPNRLGNNNLTWEKCYETNIGLDLRLFDRIGFSAEWYNKNTSGLLYNVSLSALSGYTNQWQNVGAIRNRGWEFNLSPDFIHTRDWLWTADFNIGFNKAVITSLYQGQSQILGSDMGGQQIREVGTQVNTWYLKQWAGVDVYTGEPMWYIYNKDGSRTLTDDISKATRVKMGTANPKFSGGINTNLTWKNLSLQAGFSFVYGNKIYNYARMNYDNDGAYPTYNSMVLEKGWSRWTKPGDIATHPQAIVNGNHDSAKASSRYLEDGSFFKGNNITIAYNVPVNWLRTLSVKALNVSVSGENLFTITKFSGVDPESAAGAGSGTNGAVVGSADTGDTSGGYAPPRRFSVSLNLTF